MKHLRLRFEKRNVIISTCAVLFIVMACAVGFAFSNKMIAVGCLMSIFGAGALAVLLYYALLTEVIIDFKHNRLKMKSGLKKEKCELDKVKKIEIVFHRVNKINCYSVQVIAYLNDGKTIAIKIHPEYYHYKLASYFTGKVTNRTKIHIENQVSGYEIITCRAE